uniref:Uncharacterized protein n=1 Tax=uncultured organism TaxID=155900 RepID=M1Q1A7_9ZZZZ|nr:conserved hypothetical protein, membrane [uncultured organism]
MAKRWNDEDDDLDIDIDFDRKEYMKKEITKGKSTLIAVGIAPVFSFVSRFVFNLTTDWLISLLAGLVGLVILSPLYKTLNIDVGKIGKKGWIKNGAVYAMTLLAVWVLLMNPPFGDYADPQVNDIQVEVYQGQERVKPENINSSEDYNVTLRIKITSNSDIKDKSVSIELDGESMDWEKDGDHHYVVEQENLQGKSEHTLIISMEDVNGNENTVEKSFTVE